MDDSVLVDELHLTVRVPADLPAADREAVRRALADDAFVNRLRDTISAAAREFPGLAPVTIDVAR